MPEILAGSSTSCDVSTTLLRAEICHGIRGTLTTRIAGVLVQLKHLMPGVKVNKSCEVPQDDGVEEEEVNRPEPPVGSI